jgi:peptidoglycan/LPS O-acetylase OafA/YrhL
VVNTRFLLCIAAVFVVNSHLESFYPKPAFAGDGLIGYGVFFFVSGLGLALSSRRKMRPFHEFYWRRFIRIYPTVWLITIPTAIIADLYSAPDKMPFFHMKYSDYVFKFIWPTENTFVAPLMICYIILYALLRMRPPKSILITIVFLLMPFGWIWTVVHAYGREIYELPLGAWMWRIAYCQILLFGAWLGFHMPRSKSLTYRRFLSDCIGFVLLLGVFIFLKSQMNSGILIDWYPSLFFFVAGMLWLLFRIACNPQLIKILGALGPISFLIQLLGACCLEVYFVHVLLVSWNWLEALRFPLNILLLWILLIPLSYFAERIVSWIRSGCRQFTWNIPSAAGEIWGQSP